MLPTKKVFQILDYRYVAARISYLNHVMFPVSQSSDAYDGDIHVETRFQKQNVTLTGQPELLQNFVLKRLFTFEDYSKLAQRSISHSIFVHLNLLKLIHLLFVNPIMLATLSIPFSRLT